MKILFVFLLTFSSALFALEGRVVGVHDGDTLTLLVNKKEYKVRLAQIDAPELNQPYGRVSKKSLSDLVYGKNVIISVVDTDKYGRTVGTPYLGDIDVCSYQVSHGMAWVYERYQTDPSFTEIQREARTQKKGLWNSPDPTPPWLWRKR